MNRNRMLVLAAIALILSAGVTYLAYRLLQARLQPVDTTTQIVVAAEKLALGTRLTEKQLKLTAWPKETLLEGSFSDPAQLKDRAVLVDLLPNEPILESKLAPKEGGAGLAVAIPTGMRAISIQVNSIIGVTGFVGPGSRVDLILTGMPPRSVTQNVKGAPADETGSKIVLENLQVLAAGQNVQRDVEGKPQSVQEVTLLVTPEQAEKIALATGDGRIQLALRNPLDHELVDPPLVFRSALYEGRIAESKTIKPKLPEMPAPTKRPITVRVEKVPPPPAAPVAAAPRVFAVELIQGSRRATDTFAEKKPEEKKPEEKKP